MRMDALIAALLVHWTALGNDGTVVQKAGTGLRGSPHDLHASARVNPGGGLCTPCHIPHQAPGVPPKTAATGQPGSPPDGLVPYGDAGGPGTKSQLCLGCHDGNLATDALASNGHPIGLYYRGDPSRVTKARDGQRAVLRPADGVGELPLYGSGDPHYTIECETCHDPHSNRYPPFLRLPVSDPSAPSRLCLACHDGLR